MREPAVIFYILDLVPILPKVRLISLQDICVQLQIFVACTFYISVTFYQCEKILQKHVCKIGKIVLGNLGPRSIAKLPSSAWQPVVNAPSFCWTLMLPFS
jgi:hypothetical protein